MRTTLLSVIVFCLALGLFSCNKNNGESLEVNAQMQAALHAKYPNATHIKWQSKNGYSVAHFSLPANRAISTIEHEAWFDNGAKWHMTEIDLTYPSLPQAVRTAFENSEYALWRIDDVDMLERAGVETVYIIEVEGKQNGIETDINLYYSSDGVLVKNVADTHPDDKDDDDDYSDYIPAPSTGSIEAFIQEHYPNARIVDIDHEKGMTEIEIIHQSIFRELLFDASEKWISTTTEIHSKELPAAVKSAIDASNYASYHFDSIEHVKTASNEFYIIELEKNDREITLRITPDGTILP